MITHFFKQSSSSGRPDVTHTPPSVSEEAADAVPVAPAEKRRKTRAFRPDWKEKFPWVRCNIVEDEERLFCAQCGKIREEEWLHSGVRKYAILKFNRAQSVQ